MSSALMTLITVMAARPSRGHGTASSCWVKCVESALIAAVQVWSRHGRNEELAAVGPASLNWLNFVGNVEGMDFFSGKADVIRNFGTVEG